MRLSRRLRVDGARLDGRRVRASEVRRDGLMLAEGSRVSGLVSALAFEPFSVEEFAADAEREEERDQCQ